MTERLARWSSRRPWLAIGSWIVTLIIAFGIIAVLIGSALTTNSDVTAQTESKRAEALLDKAFPPTRNTRGFSDIVVIRADQPATSPAVARRVAGLATELRNQGIGTVVTYYESKDKRLLAADGRATAVLIGLGRNGSIETVVHAVDRLDAAPGYEAAVTGDETISADFDTLSQEDLRKGELFFGAPAALVILVLVFVVNMLTGMGLALGIDYSLFILSRYREERRGGNEKHEAIGIAGATASRAVLFSGIAFVLAMFGMTLVPDTILRSLAVGAILVGIVSVPAALTLMPAILSLLGDRVNALRVQIVVEGYASSPSVKEGIGRLRSELATRTIFGEPIVNADRGGGLTALVVPIAGDADSEAATNAVEDLRSDLIPKAFEGV